MYRDTLIAQLQYRLGNRTGLEAKMIAEMDFVQQTLCEGTGAFTPWFLETEIASVSTQVDEERVQLPEDFLGEIEDQALWLYDATNEDAPYTELHKSSYDRLILRHQIAGIPSEYAMAGDYFLLRPIPDDIYTIRMRYYAQDVLPSTGNIENKWLKEAPDLILAELGTIIAGEYIRNPQLAAEYAQKATIARDRLYKRHERRMHANRTYGMGED